MPSNPKTFIDFNRAKANLKAVLEDERFSGISFRPHFKTHRSAAVGELFSNEGIEKITVSSLPMAEYFADAGWKDILIAMPLNPNHVAQYDALAARVQLHLLADHSDPLFFALSHLKNPVGFFLKADAGYGRAGWLAENTRDFLRAAEMISSFDRHSFSGILSHFGNTYHAKSAEEIKAINLSSITRLAVLKDFLETQTGKPCPLSIGDTPSLPHYSKEMLKPVAELRPGNFIYYDMMQVALGTCKTDEIALAVETDILSLYPDRGEALVHAGAVHLSKEQCRMPDGRPGSGALVRMTKNGIGEVIENCFVDRISQEHGILRVAPAFFREFHIGDSIGILPVHSCLVEK
ncbi:D-threo-3-hydroxyaspartate dehydratase [bioreactor metagenome]|uniref:D-threo-3-hydroxyaspartate dehydratase n=1 Tax=bioreactor metagenome TaxID=1076179 RepID=A0A644XSY8_9ZZZZ